MYLDHNFGLRLSLSKLLRSLDLAIRSVKSLYCLT